jgi:hypothetical protein
VFIVKEIDVRKNNEKWGLVVLKQNNAAAIQHIILFRF